MPATTSTPIVQEEDDTEETYCEAACREDGLCAILDGSCVALEDGHCATSRACENDGRCAAKNNVCVKPGSVGGVEACDRLIATVRRCMPMPPGAGNPVEDMLRSMEAALSGRGEAAQRAQLTQTCVSMLEILGQNPACKAP